MLRVLIRPTLCSSLYFSNQPIATFDITYNCLVEIELHREIYHFTHERQPLKLDSNQHSAISRSFYHLNYLSDEVWCEPVHCSLFFQYHHDTCTIAEPNHTHWSTSYFISELLFGCAIPNVSLESCIGLLHLPLIGRVLNVPLLQTRTGPHPI